MGTRSAFLPTGTEADLRMRAVEVKDAAVQGDLFDAGQREQQSTQDWTVDTIRGQFGAGAIRRGNLFDPKEG